MGEEGEEEEVKEKENVKRYAVRSLILRFISAFFPTRGAETHILIAETHSGHQSLKY